MKEISIDILLDILKKQESAEQKDKFNGWLHSSEENQTRFKQFELVFERAKEAQKYSRIDLETAWKKLEKKTVARKPNGKSRILKIVLQSAAIFVLAYVLGGGTYYLLSIQNVEEPKEEVAQYFSISAPRGSKSKVELPDGSTVWLNSDSELRYPGIFADNQREVFLTGEAYFDIAKNEAAPFFVRANSIEIKVLGTKFNVKSYPEEGTIETTLEEGLINISRVGSEQNFLLKPKQKAVFVKRYGKINTSGPVIDELKEVKPIKRKEQFILAENVETEMYTSWKDQSLIFKSEAFEQLVVKMERWYNVEIIIENERLRTKKLTGSFDKQTIEQALEALKVSFNFKYEINKNQIIIK